MDNSYVPAPILDGEEARLEELYSMRILDTASEDRFDEYVKLAADVFGVPIALISFVDRERQWFKSAYGLDATETPREVSFCGHALGEAEVLVVSNALEDRRFARNPLVLGEPHVRFYAGAVVRGPTGQPLGTCCVVDRRPREFSERERDILVRIARLVERELAARESLEQLRETVRRNVLFDATTGLPSRALFLLRLGDLIEAASTGESSIFAGVVRLKRFDALHAALGREGAGHVVEAVAARLAEKLGREVTIAHGREDELLFAMQASGVDTQGFMPWICGGLDAPFAFADRTISVRGAIGVAVYPADADDPEVLLKRARMALESLPPTETTSGRFYTRELGSRAVRRFELESELRVALDNHEFSLVYQPKVDTVEMRVVGAEALARWTSRRFGNVSPKDFVPALENSGLIVDFGAWVVRSVCRQIAAWDSAGLVCPSVALNASSRQLFDANFVTNLEMGLAATSLAGDRLNIEITESALVDDMESAIAVMNRARALGVRFSIDDFGTGFSSLSYLRRMPVHTLKIDRSFVEHVATRPEDKRLVQSIVSMAQALSLEVVAEGVEHAEQLVLLRAIGCRQVQGYLLGKPLPPDEFVRLCTRPLDCPVWPS